MHEDIRTQTSQPGVLFDLDGTLVDSVYQHVLAWQQALTSEGIDLSIWRIHRRVGMSGGLFVRALARETGRDFAPEEAQRLGRLHEEAYARRAAEVRVLPGARELLAMLTGSGIRSAIATSGSKVTAGAIMQLLDPPKSVPVITREQVRYAKPNPDLFIAAAAAIDMPVTDCFVVGDSVWDMLASQRAHSLGVGVLSGGYGREELESAGAFRVYADPADLLEHIDELGIRMR